MGNPASWPSSPFSVARAIATAVVGLVSRLFAQRTPCRSVRTPRKPDPLQVYNSIRQSGATITRAEAIHLPGWRFISAERKLQASRPGSAEVRGLRLEDVDWRAG